VSPLRRGSVLVAARPEQKGGFVVAFITAVFNTTGMHCSSCSMLIDLTLNDLEGVAGSKSDHATGTTTVEYDDAVVDSETIIGAIRSVGYEAEPVQ
jgi:copper chaperone CopZ